MCRANRAGQIRANIFNQIKELCSQNGEFGFFDFFGECMEEKPRRFAPSHFFDGFVGGSVFRRIRGMIGCQCAQGCGDGSSASGGTTSRGRGVLDGKGCFVLATVMLLVKGVSEV